MLQAQKLVAPIYLKTFKR